MGTENIKNKTIRDRVNETLLNTIGMSYDEYELLDFDEQRRVMTEYHKKHPNKSKRVTVMIGGGDSSLFIKTNKGKKILTADGHYIAGETLEENKERWENSIRKIYRKNKLKPDI